VADHFAVSLSFLISSVSYGEATVTSLGFGPFLRYHFIEQFFSQIRYSYQSIGYDGFKVSGGELSIALVGDFFLNDHVAIEPQIYSGFGSLKPEGGESQGVSDAGLLLGVQAFIGGGE